MYRKRHACAQISLSVILGLIGGQTTAEFPKHKTKIVCTIGPASRSEEVLEELVRRGMNVARLNFSHGTLEGHREDIRRVRDVAAKLNRSCTILADLPGIIIRIGKLTQRTWNCERQQCCAQF
jgi:pyruvate kinase